MASSATGETGPESAPLPFLIVSEADPYARLLAGDFRTCNGSVVRKIFLLMQRDVYHLAPDPLRPLTNPDIDALWQQAFSWYLANNQQDSFIVLSDQNGPPVQAIPFKSLFYCGVERIFFHPPCPACGAALEQCYDDAILTAAGLMPYSSSLKRYLFCPACFASRQATDFYVCEPDGNDPPHLRDRHALIRDFGRLVVGDYTDKQLPCISCQQLMTCYGSGKLAADRITPFAFYPFQLFVYEALPLQLQDFLALAGGASPEEVSSNLTAAGESGRLAYFTAISKHYRDRPPFLHADRAGFFCEILFLKLSLLHQALPFIFSFINSRAGGPASIGVDQFWVRLADFDTLLPFLWSFKVQPLGLGIAGNQEGPNYKAIAAGGIFDAALFWFYVLFANKARPPGLLSRLLEEAVNEEMLRDEAAFEHAVETGSASFWAPENIFWEPSGKRVDEQGWEFWLKTLKLGWSLLKAGLGREVGWSHSSFLQELAGLAADVKNNLNQPHPLEGAEVQAAQPETSGGPAVEDESIVSILLEIRKKWQALVNQQAEEPLATQIVRKTTDQPHARAIEENDQSLLETRVPQPPAGQVTKPAEAQQEEEIQATRILQLGKPPGQSSSAAPEEDAGGLDSTVIINRQDHTIPEGGTQPAQGITADRHIETGQPAEPTEAREERTRPPKKGDLAEELTETVILSPEDLAKLRKR